MSTYKILIRILDQIIDEAGEKYRKLYSKDTPESYNSALSRAYIHLFIKVRFNQLDFEKREYYVTDGPHDGGIDGYYIDKDEKVIYLIQSKFRVSEHNFREKEISIQELLAMDIDRILKGEVKDVSGSAYRGKILQLQRDINEIPDVPRYIFKVVVLANLYHINESDLTKLTGGYKVDVIDNQRCYKDYVFPIVSGTSYCKNDLLMQIDLSNKAANKISYTVETAVGACDITVLFVPTIEVGKFMSRYKNSILKYNPRSYLGFKGQEVNKNIAETIVNVKTNEFALFNNGITLLSEETSISENVAQKAKARLMVKNPQIINGGQTSYTLCRLYEGNTDRSLFDGKEVLMKVITLPAGYSNKEMLIERISGATNHQTPVGTSDRQSNQQEQVELQKRIFDRFGVLYERKKGEFSDGLLKGYIQNSDIVDRSMFIKIHYLQIGRLSSSKAKKLFTSHHWTSAEIMDDELIAKTLFGCRCYAKLQEIKGNASNIDLLAKVKAMTILYYPAEQKSEDARIRLLALEVDNRWAEFIDAHSDKVFKRTYRVDESGKPIAVYNKDRRKIRFWLNSEDYVNDVLSFFVLKKA